MSKLRQMNSMALSHVSSNHAPPAGLDGEARAAELRAGNINPRTGLATDYLNHFNEAVMLLEMIPDIPECADDFLEWHPLSYAEHFTASNFKARDLAISAYEQADPAIRAEFDQLTNTMTSILTAVGAAMREASQAKTRARLAEQAIHWVKPLVMAAGGVINGGSEGDIEYIMTH
jgi:outer membrane murein-binding lipoprotein Lpp